MSHVSHVDLKEQQSLRRFALPPVHLFWGASEQNQRMYYYHFLILRKEFSHCAGGDLPGLTTDEWRSILGNTYWKSMWPRPKSGNAGSSNFDPLQFWTHGGPLFFGDEMSAEVVSGRDLASVLHCSCEVQMDTADDDEVQQTILYVTPRSYLCVTRLSFSCVYLISLTMCTTGPPFLLLPDLLRT